MSLLHRLSVTLPPGCPPDETGALDALLVRRAAHGWQEDSLPDGSTVAIIHFTSPEPCADLAAEISRALPSARLRADTSEACDWLEAWKVFFTPVRAGRFLVLAPWMEEEKLAARGVPIIIEPKTAFGTGHHASTALCLEAISMLADEGRLAPGMRFLDLGTGSGILAIGCAKLGLAGDALDTDPVAVENALENRAGNAILAEHMDARAGDLEAARPPYDCVVANILAAPLISMAPVMARLGADASGRAAPPLLVLSGILASQADAVEAAFGDSGFPPARRLLREEWAALVFG